MITRSSSLWILRIGHVAVVTASVMIGPVDFAAAARNRVPSGRLVVQYTITAHARSGIVHGRLAATCVHPERRHQNFSAAADLSRIVVTFFTAALCIIAVSLLHDCFVAALVGVVVVDLGSTAG